MNAKKNSRNSVVLMLAGLACLTAAGCGKPEFKTITVGGESFKIPSRFRPTEDHSVDDTTHSKEDTGDFYLLASDLGQNIPILNSNPNPNANDDEIHIALEDYQKGNKYQEAPVNLTLDKSETYPDLKGIDYLGSDQYNDYFISHENNIYYMCDKIGMAPDPKCSVRYQHDANIEIYISFNRIHLGDVSAIVGGANKFLSSAKLKQSDK